MLVYDCSFDRSPKAVPCDAKKISVLSGTGINISKYMKIITFIAVQWNYTWDLEIRTSKFSKERNDNVEESKQINCNALKQASNIWWKASNLKVK